MVEKEPLTQEQYLEVQRSALLYTNKDGSPNKDGIKAIQLIRYTSMHISIISDPVRNNLRIEKAPDGEYIVWDRPKKKGKLAHTEIRRSRNLTFNIQDFIRDLIERRAMYDLDPNPHGKRYRIHRQYWYRLFLRIGERAGIEGLTPLTLRHTFAVQSIPVLGSELTREILNCNDKTFRHYSKYNRATRVEVFNRANW